MPSKLVLMGLSGSGKSTLRERLGGSLRADMDVALGTSQAPPVDSVLKWILDNPEPILEMGVHEETLRELAKRKSGRDRSLPSQIYLLYIRKTKEGLARCLEYPAANGKKRHDKERILNDFSKMDELFTWLAHRALLTDASIDELVAEVNRIAREQDIDLIRDIRK